MTNTGKRLRIEKSLSHKDIVQDEPFVSLMRQLALSDKNLDAVITDINTYRSSMIGIQQAHKKEVSIRVKDWDQPIFANFTPRYELRSETLTYRFQSFINTLSKKIYKNAYKRKNRRINHSSFLEGNNIATRVHIHSVIDVPPGRDINNIKSLIRKYWWNTGSVYFSENNYLTDDDIDRVSGYITKFRTKGGRDGTQLPDSLIV